MALPAFLRGRLQLSREMNLKPTLCTRLPPENAASTPL